ncbi:hypothetical protein VNO80_20678 [Phaseolus coccineus]|uniref:Uncharacterized protein n=1 Tax=Phaseolus coccineus TaxID=3886 RepID=A0AAN9M6I2_PHACN
MWRRIAISGEVLPVRWHYRPFIDRVLALAVQHARDQCNNATRKNRAGARARTHRGISVSPIRIFFFSL